MTWGSTCTRVSTGCSIDILQSGQIIPGSFIRQKSKIFSHHEAGHTWSPPRCTSFLQDRGWPYTPGPPGRTPPVTNQFSVHKYSIGSLHLLPVLELGRHRPPVLHVVHHTGRQNGGRHQEHHHDQEDDQSPPPEQAANLKVCVS